MTNILSKTLPVDSIRPDIRISLFLFNSEVYTLYEINIPAAHDNRRRNDKKVPRYSKFVDSVKFQAIKLTILISHLSSAEEKNNPYNEIQNKKFISTFNIFKSVMFNSKIIFFSCYEFQIILKRFINYFFNF